MFTLLGRYISYPSEHYLQTKDSRNKHRSDSKIVSRVSKMSDSYLSLDWRNGPPSKEIIHRLEQVFTDVDDKTKSGTTLRLSQSTAICKESVLCGGKEWPPHCDAP